jgi:pimeloyl-ACP methyl ester carboxylesterase
MTLYRSFLASLLASTALASSPCAAESATPRISDPVYMRAQRLVEIEPGRRINIYCTGSGFPAVVFDAGLTDATSVWAFVQPAISARTRACSYDRAGVGFSDPATRPGSSGNIVEDMRHLLGQAGVSPPYILVGHSYGGMNVRLFAHLHPEDVQGLVLVDPTHEEWSEGFRKLDPRQSDEWGQAQVQRFQQLRECIAAAKTGFIPGSQLTEKCSFPRDPHMSDAINDVYQVLFMRPGFQAAQLGEEESIRTTSADELRRARSPLGDLPLVVLTRAPFPLGPGESKELRDAKNQLWMNLHKDLVTLSSRGVHRVVPGAGHYIQIDQPAAVTQAILDVLDLLQGKRFRAQ